MDPISLGTVALVGTAAGGATAAIGKIFGGMADSTMYKYKAGVAELNTRIAKQNADYERKVGEVQAQQVGLRASAERAQTKAVQGASGIDVNTGSPVEVRNSELAIGRENEAVVRANAAHRAYGQEVKAMEATAEGRMDTMAASTSKTSSYIGAASTVLGTAGSVSSKWLQGQSTGLWGNDNNGLEIYGS